MIARGRRSRSVAILAVAIVLLAIPAAADWPWWRLGLLILMCAVVAWIAVIDLATLTVPDEAQLALLLLAGCALLGDGMSWHQVVWQAAVGLCCAAVLFLLCEFYGRLRGFDVLGFGDVKLAGVSGFLVGPFGLSQQVLLASLAALIFVAIRSVRRGRRLRASLRLPFATFLAPALILVWAWAGRAA